MKKVLGVLIVLLGVSGYLIYNTFHVEGKNANTIISTSNIKIIVPEGYLTKGEMAVFALKAEKAYRDIRGYMGRDEIDEGKPSQLYLKGGNFTSYTRGKYVELSYVKERGAPYLHELVHTLTINSLDRNKWMREGLAIYLNDYLGGSNTFPNFGGDIDKLSAEYLIDPEYRDILTFDDKYWSPSSIKKRQIFYLHSASLTKYIIETYGKGYFLELFNGERTDFLNEPEGEKILEEWMGKISGIATE